MKGWGFVGASYTTASRIIDGERCSNVFVTKNESPFAAAPYALTHTPGTVATWVLTDSPLRALFSQDDRPFCVAGGTLFELGPGGVVTNRGAVAAGASRASISSSGTGGHQLFVVASGLGYIYDLTTNTLTAIGSAAFPAHAAMGTFIDSYFSVLVADSNQFQLSDLFGGLTWSGLDVAQRSKSSDKLVAIIEDHDELWLFGTARTEVWNDTGASDFPFAPNPSGFLEQGAYPWTVQKFDNTLIWVGRGKGQGMVWRADGYTPRRVSDHGIEAILRKAPTLDDLEAFSYQEEGHEFYVLNSPLLERTLVLDAQTGWWHERDWWNATAMKYERARPRVACQAFGQVLVGDRTSGVVSVQSMDTLTDQGQAIHRRRRCPHLNESGRRVFYYGLRLNMQVGDGLAGSVRAPQSILRYSDDSGTTWSADLQASMGLQGEYGTEVAFQALGSSRVSRVFEWETAEAVPICITDAFLDAQVGTR